MATRITWKMVKEWFKTEKLYNDLQMYLEAYNGYYYLKDCNGRCAICAKTPGILWKYWDVFKSGYMAGSYDKVTRG